MSDYLIKLGFAGKHKALEGAMVEAGNKYVM